MIWYKNFKDFLSYDNLTKFFPSKRMTEVERLNALFRFSCYLAILFYLYNKNEKVFIIPFVTGIYTFYIYTHLGNVYKTLEKYENMSQKSSRHPTQDNPFMNPNLITERNPNAPADSIFSKKTKNEISKLFYKNTYADPDDVYNRNNPANRFYTTPSTTIPNRQDEFANFLYGNMTSRKEQNY